MPPHLSRAGEWFLRSGIQEPTGGVARYYRTDTASNLPVSTEITGYALSALVYLQTLTGDARYCEAADSAARFLAGSAWDAASRVMPFETATPAATYFFDCGIIVRGLLAAWRVIGGDEYLDVAAALGRSMAVDFAAPDGSFHPILSLPGKRPVERDPLSWSRSTGCYQLKAAMAWWELWEATGDAAFREPYERVLEDSLRTYAAFLPGHPERLKVMDRLHAFTYFLEGLLPRVSEERCAAALRDGIGLVEHYLREIGPEFDRSDVYAQLLRVRLYADWAGAAPLDGEAARFEAAQLASFQASDGDPRIDGGWRFGRKRGAWLPYVNPVSTAFAVQALALWESHRAGEPAHRHLLV